METQNSHHGQIIEIRRDVAVGESSSLGRSKICGDAPCGFSDFRVTSKDAKERSASMRKLLIAVVLCIVFMSVEVVGGIEANSLAILTDAAHLLSDVASFAISLFSMWAASWEATPRQSYGFFRIEILGALVSIQIIWLITGILVYEAIIRLIDGTTEVKGYLMFVIATFGLVVNIIMAFLLGHDHGHGHSHGHSHGSHHGHDQNQGLTVTTPHHHSHDEDHPKDENHHHGHSDLPKDEGHHHGHSDHPKDEPCHADEEAVQSLLDKAEPENVPKKKRNINLQGAYLHILGDSIQSIGVMIGGGIIWLKPGWKIVDLICTLIFSVIVLGTTIQMLRNILEVLMESTPREIDAGRLEKGLLEMEEVVAIHELHIWAVTVGKVLLACHVKITPEADADVVLDNVIDYIRREYNISHVTIQIER